MVRLSLINTARVSTADPEEEMKPSHSEPSFVSSSRTCYMSSWAQRAVHWPPNK